MLSPYPACFFKEENGYSIIFLDLDYLATYSKTIERFLGRNYARQLLCLSTQKPR